MTTQQADTDEDTKLVGARKKNKRQGAYGSLEFVFHRDYPIGVEGVDEMICLRVFKSKKMLKEEDHRVEIVRKELRGDKLVAIYRGHPNTDSAQLQFVDELKLAEALSQAKADMAYEQHLKEQRRAQQPRRRRPRNRPKAKVAAKIRIPDSVRERIEAPAPHQPKPLAPRTMSNRPLTAKHLMISMRLLQHDIDRALRNIGR